jgi:hypothetical protein
MADEHHHKNAKEWAVRSGAIMEDIITNFEFKNAADPRVPLLRAYSGSALRSSMRTKGAGAALPEVHLQLPGNARDVGQYGGFQGRRVTHP